MTANTRVQIRIALRGEPSEARIYWDKQDPANEGPAYRCGEESGPLEMFDWEALDKPGKIYDWGNLSDYFGADGSYKGPDCFGVYPVLQ